MPSNFTNSIYIKGQTNSKWFFQAKVSSKTRTNEFNFTTIKVQFDLFSFILWKKLKTPKRHFEINWPLGGVKMASKRTPAKPRHFCKWNMATSWMAFLNLNLNVLQVATPNSNNRERSVVQNCTSDIP